jgi:predicted nuclease of predicted toxin-antitoxin system
LKLLLDECLPRKLKGMLACHDVSTVPEMGWAGVKNGALLALAAPVFDVFITVDRNLKYQQNLVGKEIAVVALSAADNTLSTLSNMIPKLVETLPLVRPGQVVTLS